MTNFYKNDKSKAIFEIYKPKCILQSFFVILEHKNIFMDITGKIIKILPLQSGQGKNGEWRKQDFVIQIEGPYPKIVCFTMWNAKIDQNPLLEDQSVKVSFDPESREYNGKYYTDLIAWRIEQLGGGTPQSGPADVDFINSQPDAVPDDSTDDLPF